MAKNATKLLQTPAFRMSYAKLATPSSFMENGKPKGDPNYSVEMIFDLADLEKFKVRGEGEWRDAGLPTVLVALCKEEWGEDFSPKEAAASADPAQRLAWPIQDGTTKAEEGKKKAKDWEAYRGKKVLRAKAKDQYPPQLFVVSGGEYKELDRSNPADMATIKSKFVSGYYAKANVNVVAQKTAQGRFLTFYLNSVLFVKAGERIGGMSGEDRFGGVEGGAADVDATAGMDDEIPY